ncbi:hypothetical protein Niako_0403 [Niastella koreensis GR20-10]|uniref:Uncharacterized protein n=1 Tax=Niastella koreensis (strain DSM 17620 / KACC 11465 / NBRC 106392 / GR20-10) TaxID=700598 RepID=G8TQR7_NIAKG|nr:hypothetical protein Niako_0403 [Niastella koreensis GR20-10]
MCEVWPGRIMRNVDQVDRVARVDKGEKEMKNEKFGMRNEEGVDQLIS